MSKKEEYNEIEEDIRERRALPYTLTIEKMEGNKIYTHNIWGNSVIFLKSDDGNYTVYQEKD